MVTKMRGLVAQSITKLMVWFKAQWAHFHGAASDAEWEDFSTWRAEKDLEEAEKQESEFLAWQDEQERLDWEKWDQDLDELYDSHYDKEAYDDPAWCYDCHKDIAFCECICYVCYERLEDCECTCALCGNPNQGGHLCEECESIWDDTKQGPMPSSADEMGKCEECGVTFNNKYRLVIEGDIRCHERIKDIRSTRACPDCCRKTAE